MLRRRGARDPRGPLERAVGAGLAWARVGIGAAAWLAPRGSMRLLGFDPANAQVMSLARLAGTRDLALGAVAVSTHRDPGTAATVAGLNAAVDALDAVAFLIALLRRQGIDRASSLGAGGAAAAALTGAWLARRQESKS
jgi:hypothetical protein